MRFRALRDEIGDVVGNMAFGEHKSELFERWCVQKLRGY